MTKQNKNNVVSEVGEVIETVDRTVMGVVKETDKYIEPVRRSAGKRFPTMFLLLTTFGVAATIFAFERLISEWVYLYERPWLILSIGIGTLVLTGTLYKKLG